VASCVSGSVGSPLHATVENNEGATKSHFTTGAVTEKPIVLSTQSTPHHGCHSDDRGVEGSTEPHEVTATARPYVGNAVHTESDGSRDMSLSGSESYSISDGLLPGLSMEAIELRSVPKGSCDNL
jgi:hypothetical protein